MDDVASRASFWLMSAIAKAKIGLHEGGQIASYYPPTGHLLTKFTIFGKNINYTVIQCKFLAFRTSQIQQLSSNIYSDLRQAILHEFRTQYFEIDLSEIFSGLFKTRLKISACAR